MGGGEHVKRYLAAVVLLLAFVALAVGGLAGWPWN
jgi:hypothetical protein